MLSAIKSQDLNREIKSPNILQIENLSLTECKVMNMLLYLTGQFEQVWVRQFKIAQYAGISREWCNKILRKLEKLGLIAIKNRGYNGFLQMGRSCLYRVANWFGNAQIRFRLSSLFPALRQHSLFHFTQYVYSSLFTIRSRSVCVYTTTDNDTTKKMVRTGTGRTDLKSEKGKEMVEEKIPVAVKNISVLNLTKWGQIKLAGFPEDAIVHAQGQMKKINKPLNDSFRYFFSICQTYCRQNGLRPDWMLVDKLRTESGMADDAPMLNSEPNQAKFQSSRSVKSGPQISPEQLEERKQKAAEQEEFLKRKAQAYNYMDHKAAQARGEEYTSKLDWTKPLPSEEIEHERTCPEVARQLAQMREYKKTETYKKACQVAGFAEYTSLVEYRIAQTSKCGGKCDYCQLASKAGF